MKLKVKFRGPPRLTQAPLEERKLHPMKITGNMEASHLCACISDPPEILEEPEDVLMFSPGAPVLFSLRHSGHAPLSVRWFHRPGFARDVGVAETPVEESSRWDGCGAEQVRLPTVFPDACTPAPQGRGGPSWCAGHSGVAVLRPWYVSSGGGQRGWGGGH